MIQALRFGITCAEVSERALKKSNRERFCWNVNLQLDLKLLERQKLSQGSPKGEHSSWPL